MIKKHSFTWRKSIVFSATFLLVALVSVSCKKKENQIGLNTIDQNDILSSSGLDTFTLKTYSIRQDSTITKDNLATLLGSYNDPTFGMVSGEIFTQVQLEELSPDFGDLTTVSIDSFILGMVYSGSYGENGDQTIEVFEINDPDGISKDSSYYQFSDLTSLETVNWVDPNESIVNMNPDATTIIAGTEVPSQLRIHLDTNRAREIMEDAALQPSSFADADAFLDYFKGIHVRTANVGQNSGDGGVFYFNMKSASTKMTIYYTIAGEQKTFDFRINTETTHFNKVVTEIGMTDVQNVIDNNDFGQNAWYAQAFNCRAVVEMPTITEIPENAVLHSAVMTLSVSHQTGENYSPAGAISVLRRDPDDESRFIAIGNAVYNSSSKQYSFDLRFHVQRVLNGELENTPLFISPLFFNSSADRIIFNGPETINKVKPSLRILFTEF